MKFLLPIGSLRAESFNRRLCRDIVAYLTEGGHACTPLDFKENPLPFMDQDLEKDGLPAAAQAMVERVAGADALIFCTPEYNASLSPITKNFIDWVSRARPHPWAGKPVLLAGASPGRFGATRGLLQLRVPLDSLGSYVYPEAFGVAAADAAFGPQGLTDAKTKERLHALLDKFAAFAKKFAV